MAETFKDIPEFKLPSDDTVIWHYLKFEYLEKIIATSQIRLSPVPSFKDQTEGVHDTENDITKKQRLNQLLKGNGNVLEGEADNLARAVFYASCWHINDYENEAFWARGCSTTVALKSTIGQLRAIVPVDQYPYKYHFYRVAYYREPEITLPAPPEDASILYHFLKKDVAFSYEKEVRVLAYDFNKLSNNHPDSSEPHGIFVTIPINFHKLINEIYINPYSTEEEKWEIIKFCAERGIKVNTSKIYGVDQQVYG